VVAVYPRRNRLVGGLTIDGLLADTAGLNLRRTLHSGQAFRWRWQSLNGQDVAASVIGRRIVRLAPDAAGIRLLSPATPDAREHIRRYLGAVPRDGHPRRVEAALARDPVLRKVLPYTAGLSLLAQDPWEIFISFIISQNNNIPKITRSIEGLARALGEPLADGLFAFPRPERLAAAQMRTLAACSLGYRAAYVRAAARLVVSGRLDLRALAQMDREEARAALLGIPGIGEKVGDCVLLFGLGHRTAFPVDVWVRRAVERLYFGGRPRTLRDIQAFARERFGLLAGYAQQHLFVYARNRLRPGTAGIN
jgi:N-glycosylase/DNA lyase